MPNFSAGRDSSRISDLERSFGDGVRLLDRHADPDHDRSVFTLAGEAAALSAALVGGAAEAIRSIEMSAYAGLHPAVGALDVCPVVWLFPRDRDSAGEVALATAAEIGALGVPVFLYGALATGVDRVERSYFRNGGLSELWLRMESGELRPDYGPELPHATAGATLVTARPPLGAFNVELDVGDVEVARAVAAGLRESGGGLSGVRAIGLLLGNGRAQVSTNIHDPAVVTLGTVVERVRGLAAPLGARPVEAELVGLVPGDALVDYPEDVPIRDFDSQPRTIEAALADLS
ncbi:MAG TPA: hypothetical protein VFI09_00955 [Solirubrobacterales bacterium]|nr:hypothetical protein [Solirubrobacterales bacterium]